MKAVEVRERARALREERAALQDKLAAARGREARAVQRELAAVEEDLVDCARRLRELLPKHSISRGTTWAGIDGWQWDKMQYKTWAELEGAEDPEGPTERDKMRLAVRAARTRISPTQANYLTQADQGKRPAQVARETGKHRSTVCRALQRGKKQIEEDAKALYQLLGCQEGKTLVVDLEDPAVLKLVLDRLTLRQQTYLYLYYGEWLSLREIGSLLGVDHASVLRSIRCGLKRMERLALGEQVEVRGLDSLEERLMAHFNHLPPEDEPREKRTYRKQNQSAKKPQPVALLPRLLRFIRENGVRTVVLGHGADTMVKGSWGSGRLIAWLEAHGGGRKEKGALFRRLLYHLFSWIRRDLDDDHH